MPSYELSPEAAQDWRNIVRYTLDQHGEEQVHKYMERLTKCIENLINRNPHVKTISVNEHIVSVIRCQKHYIFSLKIDNRPELIIAFLHERMEFIMRLKSRLS